MDQPEDKFYEEGKKVKITYDEYQKLAFMIVDAMKELERTSGQESI
jgi:hypothetical protein